MCPNRRSFGFGVVNGSRMERYIYFSFIELFIPLSFFFFFKIIRYLFYYQLIFFSISNECNTDVFQDEFRVYDVSPPDAQDVVRSKLTAQSTTRSGAVTCQVRAPIVSRIDQIK